ncbi:hypothetical protein Bbelb_383300 [Branchiostoma belcheri]|nr:hypothetical protein Bbelb_383300 [Branchiostoma belcheri]
MNTLHDQCYTCAQVTPGQVTPGESCGQVYGRCTPERHVQVTYRISRAVAGSKPARIPQLCRPSPRQRKLHSPRPPPSTLPPSNARTKPASPAHPPYNTTGDRTLPKQDHHVRIRSYSSRSGSSFAVIYTRVDPARVIPLRQILWISSGPCVRERRRKEDNKELDLLLKRLQDTRTSSQDRCGTIQCPQKTPTDVYKNCQTRGTKE